MKKERSEFKQVIAVRVDLGMGKGKLAVQVAHASLQAADKAREKYREWYEKWLNQGQPKIAVKVSSLKELLELKKEAEEAGLPTALVEDRGLTQIEPGTTTALAIGPAPAEKIDPITGKLKLL